MSFQLDPEFVTLISEICTDMIVNGELELVPDVWDTKTIEKIEVTDIETITIDLDALASSELGFTDPLGQLKQFFSDVLNSVISWATETIGGTVKGFIDWLWEQISPSLNSIASWIDEATTQLTNLGSAFTGFVNAILKFPEWFPTWFKENIADPISEALSTLASLVWEKLPDWLKDAITTLQELPSKLGDVIDAIKGIIPDWLESTLKDIPNAISDLIKSMENFFKDPVGTLRSAFDSLAQRIWELLPDPVKGFFEKAEEFLTTTWDAIIDLFTVKLPNFISWLSTEFQAFLKDPLSYLKEKVLIPLMKGISWLWGQISNIFSGILSAISSWVSDLTIKFVKIGEAIIEKLVDFGTGLVESLVDLSKKVSEAFSSTLQNLLKGLISPLQDFVKKSFKEMFEGKQGEIDLILGIGIVILPQYLVIAMLPRFFMTLAHLAREVRIRIEERESPLGIGGLISIDVCKRLAHVFYELGYALNSLPEKVGTALIRSYTLMGLEPLRFPFRYAWKQRFRMLGLGDVPFELPPLGMSRDLVRRLGIKEASKKYRMILEYRGFPDWFIDNFVKLENELYITITDRFGKPRTIPLGLLYAQPSLSLLATMMVRDLFQEGLEGLKDFQKWAYRLGLHQNVSRLIYFLHFRYPSPSRLWSFVMRGISNMLWYIPPNDEVKRAAKMAEALGTFVPTPPAKLIDKFVTDGKPKYVPFFEALSKYMKWQDYANFSWIEGFTSDNWIVMDTLADIPTKIDVRWMSKWGIFDFMTDKGIGKESPAIDFLKVIEREKANPQVVVDLTLACRLLQATGLHPYYVPIVAVAENINALADERTLLRTGLINLYEYGAMGFKSLDELMSSLAIVSFKVAYFNMVKKEWDDGYINLPVMFLPSERRLLALRALIDRYLRVYRDTLHDLERAYTEYILEDKDVISKMNQVIEAINTEFTTASTNIVGKEYKLALDTSYINATLASWNVAREIYTIRRIRSWVYRVLGWVIYRSAYGYVTEDDAINIANILADAAKLPQDEADIIREILKSMVGIARKEYQREYIPTPLSLASMAEYVPLVRMFANRVFETKGVPSEWRSFWLQYIDIRAIVDEVRRVQSSVEQLYEYFMIDTTMFTKFLEMLKPFGYEDRELKLITDRANLDRWYRAYRELVGTPRELVTMAEYSPLARRLALAEVKKRIDALPIEQEAKEFLYKIWEDYIRIRPVYDEVEREVTELITDYARGALTWEQFNTLLEELKDWGIDEWEADAIRFLAMIRRRRYELTGYVTTPEEVVEETQA